MPFLGVVDKIGTAYEDDVLATGFGAYIALPLMREKYRPDMEEGEARALLMDCLGILFFRDCRALNPVQIAKVTTGGGRIGQRTVQAGYILGLQGLCLQQE